MATHRTLFTSFVYRQSLLLLDIPTNRYAHTLSSISLKMSKFINFLGLRRCKTLNSLTCLEIEWFKAYFFLSSSSDGTFYQSIYGFFTKKIKIDKMMKNWKLNSTSTFLWKMFHFLHLRQILGIVYNSSLIYLLQVNSEYTIFANYSGWLNFFP